VEALNAHIVLIRKHEALTSETGCRWEDNIKTGFKDKLN
jgi:hypothetical protein